MSCEVFNADGDNILLPIYNFTNYSWKINFFYDNTKNENGSDNLQEFAMSFLVWNGRKKKNYEALF